MSWVREEFCYRIVIFYCVNLYDYYEFGSHYILFLQPLKKTSTILSVPFLLRESKRAGDLKIYVAKPKKVACGKFLRG